LCPSAAIESVSAATTDRRTSGATFAKAGRRCDRFLILDAVAWLGYAAASSPAAVCVISFVLRASRTIDWESSRIMDERRSAVQSGDFEQLEGLGWHDQVVVMDQPANAPVPRADSSTRYGGGDPCMWPKRHPQGLTYETMGGRSR